MRLIRAGGRTHCWVVHSLLREQEREHFRATRKRQFLRARACIPRQNTSTEIKARSLAYTGGRTSRISRSVQSFVCIEIEEQNNIYLCPYDTDLSVSTTVLWHRFRGGTYNRTQAVSYGFCTGPYSAFLIQKSRQVDVVFLESLARFSRRSYNH
jgi:hypothetical protein